jgi:hypothetical protein
VFARARISIPTAVSIVGFDDIEMAHLARNPLTTVRQPLERQVQSASTDLVDMLQGAKPAEFVEHRTRLVLRRSCGCALVTTERISSSPPPRDWACSVEALREYRVAIAADRTIANCSISNTEFIDYSGVSRGYPRIQSFTAPASEISGFDVHLENAVIAGQSFQIRILSAPPNVISRTEIDAADLDSKTLAIAQNATTGAAAFLAHELARPSRCSSGGTRALANERTRRRLARFSGASGTARSGR